MRNDDAVEVREYAMHSLANYEDPAIFEALLDTLSEGSDNLVRMKAAWQAWRYDEDKMVSALREAVLCDIDSNIRLWAAESLLLLYRSRGLPEELVPVWESAAHDQSVGVSVVATRALGFAVRFSS